MSKLSSWVSKHVGIPKSVQGAIVKAVPGAAAIGKVGQTLEGIFGNPFTGVVKPASDPISVALGLGPGGVLDTGTSVTKQSDGPFAGGVSSGSSSTAPSGLTRSGAPRGHHLSKDGTKWVRNRHMNAANGRALARAARRLRRGEKLFRKVYTILHKQAPGKITPKRK